MINRLFLILLLALSLNGCLYKMDIYQGNVLDQEQIDQIETGMSKNQVLRILGSPQLTDPFHSQRWDYYSMSNLENQKEKTENRLTLIFKQDSLHEIIRELDLPKPEPEPDNY